MCVRPLNLQDKAKLIMMDNFLIHACIQSSSISLRLFCIYVPDDLSIFVSDISLPSLDIRTFCIKSLGVLLLFLCFWITKGVLVVVLEHLVGIYYEYLWTWAFFFFFKSEGILLLFQLSYLSWVCLIVSSWFNVVVQMNLKFIHFF